MPTLRRLYRPEYGTLQIEEATTIGPSPLLGRRADGFAGRDLKTDSAVTCACVTAARISAHVICWRRRRVVLRRGNVALTVDDDLTWLASGVSGVGQRGRRTDDAEHNACDRQSLM